MRLEGFDGFELLGFMAALGLLRLLESRWVANGGSGIRPTLGFDPDGRARISGLGNDLKSECGALRDQMLRDAAIFSGELAAIDKPSDFHVDGVRAAATLASQALVRWVACLAAPVPRGGWEVDESTLCAANGASHQKLVQSMRDVINDATPERLFDCLVGPWRRAFTKSGRKPSLRLDPGDERLHALRAVNPTSNEVPYRTEVGAQALAAFGFLFFPVCPQNRRSITVASRRGRGEVFFHWCLWQPQATVVTLQSFLCADAGDERARRAQGAFAAVRCSRVSGEKGKLSFSPSEGLW
jgi:hypothetical protein